MLCCPPERCILSGACAVMEGQKLSDAVNAICNGFVVTPDAVFIGRGAREVAYQLLDPVLNEEDASGLQRLDKAAGKADCHTVLNP